MASPSRTRTSSLLRTVAVAAFAASACAAPSLTPALADLEVRVSVAKTNFGASCTNIAYFGYCRIEADCTSDGSDVTDKDKGSLQHTFLDMGQCIGYDAPSKALKWRSKSVAHWQSTYCAPCSHCTIDPKTTKLTCQCQYADATNNHATYLTLSDHVSNTAGVLSCLNVAGDRDNND